MTGKALPNRSRKDRPRNSRPYDRPNQSILGKVASTVKGLFTPSWLFNVGNWARANEEEIEETVVNPEEATEADLTENEDEPEVQPSRPTISGRIKRPRLETQEDVAPAAEIPFWLGPSTSQDNLSQEIEKNVQTITSDCEPVRKETPVIVNGDDHSENSDGSASTSGCSSLVSSHDKPHRSSGLKLSESALELLRAELKNKPSLHHRRKEAATLTTDLLESSHNLSCGSGSLWSRRIPSPSRSPQVPSLLSCSRPSFNLSSFGGPSKDQSSSNKISSPFYEGSTAFGGASAYRRRTMANTPYQCNPTNPVHQLRVKENTSKRNFDCMSSAAKRILHTLETMSTPIADAKKIPNVCRSPLDVPLTITPPSHRMKSFLSVSRNSPASSAKGPPIVNLNTVSKLAVLRNHRSKMRNSMMELPLSEQPMVSLPEECTIGKTHDVGNGVASRIAISSGGGKMKTKLREPLHASSKAKAAEENIQNYVLPSVPLPITSNMPVFKFHSTSPSKKLVESSPSCELNVTQEVSSEQAIALSSNSEPAFTFASPIEYVPPVNSFKAPNTVENSFKFSSPLIIGSTSSSPQERSKSETKEKKTEIYTDRSVDDILKSLSEKSKQEKAGKDETSTKSNLKQAHQNSGPSPAISNIGFNVQREPGSWECVTCLVRNQSSTSKCVACETPKPDSGQESKSVLGFGDKFKLHKDTCECSACLVKNDSSKDKGVACESQKASSISASAISGSKSEFVEEVPASISSGKLFQNTSGTWECDTCLVRNALDKNKCIACETLRPSKAKTGLSNSLPFKFDTKVSSSSAASFNFSSIVSTSVPTTVTSTFTFGVTAEPDKTVPLTSGFSFGSSTISPAAIFGNSTITSSCESKVVSKETTPKAEENFKFGTFTPVSSSESIKQNIAIPVVSSTGKEELQTSVAAVGVGFQYTKPPSATKQTAENVQFTNECLKKPSVVESSAVVGGFKFPNASMGSSMTSTVKFGTFAVPKTSATPTETSTPEPSKINFSVASTLPSFNAGGMVTSQSDTFHSKTTVSQKIDKPTESRAEANPQSVGSTLSSATPMFTFGAVTSAPATGVANTVSADVVFGGFGNNALQTGQAPTKGASKSNNVVQKATAASVVPQTVATTAVGSGFSFQASSMFPSTPATSVSAKESNNASQDPAPRTQANSPFMFGSIPSTTTSMFTLGCSNPFTTVNATSTLVAKTVDSSQATQKSSGLFTFGAPSSKIVAEPSQPAGLTFKGAKDDSKNFFSQPNQGQFGAFKPQPANSSSSMSSVPSSFVFTFGSGAPSSTSSTIFPPTTKSDNTAAFTFGSAPPKPSFGGFQPSQQPVTSSMPAFFGSNIPVVTTTATAPAFNPAGSPAFAFTAKSNMPSSLTSPSVVPSVTPVAFGSSTVQPVFGASTPAPTFCSSVPAPAFGNTAASAFGNVSVPKAETSGGFNFNPQQQCSQPPNLFAFGASAEKKLQTGPTQGTGFTFGASPQVDANTNFTPSFNVTNFNFGGAATSTPGSQPFQFAASSEINSTTTSSAPRKIRKAIRRGIRKTD